VTGHFGTVPRIWPGSTVVCIAAGPSLTAADVDYCRGRARVIAVNKSVILAPWADAFFAADGRLWAWEADRLARFPGLTFALELTAASKAAGCTLLKNAGIWGLSLEPDRICNGRNSGYGAVNLAVLLGAVRIVLLGYDLQAGPDGRTHWHGDHPHGAGPTELIFRAWRGAFKSLVDPLAAAGVTVINCTRETALDAFPRGTLADVLDGRLDNQRSALLECGP
jgi:hypothetical protein